MRTAGTRASTATPTPTAPTTWPTLDQSVMANAGDMEVEEEARDEVRTVRIVEPAEARDQDDLSQEVLAMDVDRDEETRAREMGRARGRDRSGGIGKNTRRYMDD